MLPIDPELIAGIEQYAGMSRTPARGRLARRLAQQLRYEDLEALESALEGDSERDQLLRALERWRTKLIAGDDSTIQAFIEEHPTADRQRLRALVRNARGEGASAQKAQKALFAALREAGESSP